MVFHLTQTLNNPLWASLFSILSELEKLGNIAQPSKEPSLGMPYF